MKQNKHALREQAEAWGDKFAVCWWYGQSYDVSRWWTTERRQKCQTEDKPRWGQRQAEKNKSRPQRGGGFSLNLYLPGVSRWSGVIPHGISRYIVISYSISRDITRYDISRYCIHIPNFGSDTKFGAPRYSVCTYHNAQEDVFYFLFPCNIIILQNHWVQVLQVGDNCHNNTIGYIAPSKSGSIGYTAIS